MIGAALQISTALSLLGSLYPYLESQILMEYSKEIFTCKVLDGQVMEGRYKVFDGAIYFHDQIYLTKDSKLKYKILNVAYEIFLSKPISFIKTYHTILDRFMWVKFKEEMHSHMRKCMDYFLVEEEHSSWEELSLPPPYSLGVRGSSSMSYLTNLNQVYGKNCIFEHHNVSTICLYLLNTHVQGLSPRGGTFSYGLHGPLWAMSNADVGHYLGDLGEMMYSSSWNS